MLGKSIVLSLVIGILSFSGEAIAFPRVDAAVVDYDFAVKNLKEKFQQVPEEPEKVDWAKAKMRHMVEIDQYMRSQMDLPFRHSYSAEETEYFWKLFGMRVSEVDSSNTADLKQLLKRYNWFTISKFGVQADRDAWLIVQHADLDVAFQKSVLAILEKLYPLNETSRPNFAYLYDRVATNENRLQKYGTQGKCVGPGLWEPHSIEDADRVDERRQQMGMETMAEYKNRFKDICH